MIALMEQCAEDNAYVTDPPKESKDSKMPIQVLLEASVLKQIDDLRRAVIGKIPSRTQVIRDLISLGLKHTKKPTKKEF